ECCPCAEFNAELKVKNIYREDYIQEKCGTGTSTNTNKKWPIRGTVFDNNGEPLPYANVIIPGAQYANGSPCGATTDFDGAWTINDCTNIPSDPKLKITYTGYTTQEIPLSSFTNGNKITLAEDGLTLSEVLVTECAPTNANYPGAIVFERASDGKCYPTACDEPRYKLTGTGTSAKCQEQKCEISNAARTEWTGEKNAWKCIVLDCKDKYKKNDDSTACIEMLRECTDEQNAAHPNATQTGIKSGTETCIALECKCRYDLVNEQCVAWPATGKECTANTKPELPSHATGAIMNCDTNGKPYCEISGCENNYTKNDSNTKCEKLRGECTHTAPNVKKAKYKKVDGNRICVITKCNDGYMLSDDGKKCEVSEGPCNEAQLATVENATKGELKKGKCRATECKPGYEVEKHKCVEIAGNCPDKPENAKESHREFDSNTQAEVCIIDECKDGYKVSDDSKSCIEIEKPKLSREDSQKKIDELQKNANAMKEKEQSTANKLLGGAAIGATGIGAMQAASAYSEQQADEEAEQAMKAYLATFHCNYGGGINVP
ncbi:MAG: carboxypeptidase-like regulatory domain-containing protein, partial [Alphaproteobacteria bacterium]|nr:carboxypeptidase-like regulatory domain-containing protein [Alphaproteobacteria bacterium]